MNDKERIDQLEKGMAHLVLALTNVLAVVQQHEQTLEKMSSDFKVLAREIYRVGE